MPQKYCSIQAFNVLPARKTTSSVLQDFKFYTYEQFQNIPNGSITW
jgi:hypothetical protein